MDYSTIWDPKTSCSSTYTWSDNSFRIAGNRIVVEGGKVISFENSSLDDVIIIRVEPEIRYRGPIGMTSADLSGMTINSPITFPSNKPTYKIRKIQVNPSKKATTVIFEDGKVVVVKRHEGDPEVDICSVVAYALAERVYGSNSAFKRHVKNCTIEYISKDKEKLEAELL